MGLWCKDYPFVTVECSRVLKPLTLVLPYYEHPEFFSRQIAHWSKFPSHLREHLSVIVVDDASPHAAAATVLAAHPAKGVDIRVFRIHDDLKWNWLAARNIGAWEATTVWLLLTDMDHVLPVDTLNALLAGVHRTDTIYGFSRLEHTGKAATPHANSFYLTREMYWTWGGYDETLSGHYGTNGDAYRRMAKTAKMAILTDVLVRHEFVADASTTGLPRKLPADAAAVKKIVAARGADWRPKVLSFPYSAVPQHQEVAC